MLLVRNLLSDYSELVTLLSTQLDAARDGDPDETLDAFLLAAGLNQVVEDHLHRDLLGLEKAGSLLPRPAAVIVRAAHAVGVTARAALPRERRLVRHQRQIAELTGRLADVVAGDPAETHAAPELRRVPGGLAREIVRLPNCFRSFDQHPDDCRRLAELFAARGGEPARPLLVLGLRTSGSYLAPLTASFLRRLGFEHVESMTFRPGRRWIPGERRRLRRLGRSDGMVLLIDDPPRTGGQLRRAAEEMPSLGVPSDSVVVLVPTLGQGLPEPLAGLDVVELPWERWSVHERLAPESVAETLADLRGHRPRRLEQLEVRSGRAAAERSHASALYGLEGDERVLVRGVGLGYLGRHALALVEALPEFLPRVHGVRDGLLYREWLPEDERLEPHQAGDRRVARELAAYTAARLERLPVDDDASLRLLGRDALWEHVAALLARAFGKLRLPLRPALQQAARVLVRAHQPAVPDGSMHLTSWFDGVSLVKAEFEERSFAASGLTLYNFDPAFDLATAATEADEDVARLLLAEYESLAGTRVTRERWLLYRLLRFSNAHRRALREGGDDAAAHLLELEQAMARAHRSYVSELFFSDVEAPGTGPLCAIDIDGVLETRWLPYPALGPSGALALRSLIRHGYRPVLVTGRSVEDVRERCDAYRLTAGVAEYGGALCVDGAGTSLLPERAQADLESLRATLLYTPGVYVDPGYGRGVRAYDASGTGGLEPALADWALSEAGVAGRIRTIEGELQTDFMADGVDKGTGLTALRERLGDDAPVALAVGDSTSDLPMLALAERRFAPGNASASLRENGTVSITRAPYQAGLAAAVAALIGHKPGGCDRCRAPRLSLDAQLLMQVLAAQDASRWGKLRHGLALARLARKAA